MEPASTPRRRSEQDQELADELVAWERSLEAAHDDPEVLTELAEAEYPVEEIEAALALVESAQTGFEHRARAMAAEDAAVDAKAAAFKSVRTAYRAFRRIARSRFHDDRDAMTALGLTGTAPRALNPYAMHLRSGYAAAAQEPYHSKLGRGYTTERLQALRGEVDGLVSAAEDLTRAEARAEAATTARDAEAAAARSAYGEFREVALAVLSPELLARLGLG